MCTSYLIYQVELPDMWERTTIRGVSRDGKRGVLTLDRAQFEEVMSELNVSDANQMFGCEFVVEKDGDKIVYAFLPEKFDELLVIDGKYYTQKKGEEKKHVKLHTICVNMYVI